MLLRKNLLCNVWSLFWGAFFTLLKKNIKKKIKKVEETGKEMREGGSGEVLEPGSNSERP